MEAIGLDGKLFGLFVAYFFVGRSLGSELSIRHCRGTWAINTGLGFRFFPDKPKHREEDRRSGRWRRYSQLLHRTIILVAELRFRPL